MKTLCLLAVSFCLSLRSQAQHSLTGLWTGTLTNDSITIRKQQPFELALTEYQGKVYGYSRSSFIVNDTLYFIIRRVKGTIEEGLCEVKDDAILSTNFPVRPDKGIKVTYTFHQRKEDSTWHLDGNWKTNKTKTFYSISGNITLRSEANLDSSKLFPHLEELGKADDMAFYKEAKAATARTNAAKTIPVTKEPPQQPAGKESRTLAKTEKEEKKIPSVETKVPASQASALTTPIAAASVKERTVNTPQVVLFKSDSLVLALYDNGEVDGDTVSLLLNGEVIIAKQMLKASALRKTIYLPVGVEESTLILYAENLGKYPPNTGLLVIQDGEETYQLRFSADLNQNASIIFRRKKG